MRATIAYYTGQIGSSKTWMRVRWLVDEFLPQESGVYWTNLPLNPSKIAEYCARTHGLDGEQVLARLKVIPDEEMLRWRVNVDNKETPGTGPWDYFRDTDLSGAHIDIDEIHEYCGKAHSNLHKRTWSNWLAQVRHREATFAAITQSPEKVPASFEADVQQHFYVFSDELIRDVIFSIRNADWHELRAALLRMLFPGRPNYRYYWFMIYKEEVVHHGRKRQVTDRERYPLDSKYFPLYNSFSAGHDTTRSGRKGQTRYFWTHNFPQTLLWFVGRNWWRLATRLSVAAFLIWLLPPFWGGEIIMAKLMTAGKTAFSTRPDKARSPVGGKAMAAELPAQEIPPAAVKRHAPARTVTPAEMGYVLTTEGGWEEVEIPPPVDPEADCASCPDDEDQLTTGPERLPPLVAVGEGYVILKGTNKLRVGDAVPGVETEIRIHAIDEKRRGVLFSDGRDDSLFRMRRAQIKRGE